MKRRILPSGKLLVVHEGLAEYSFIRFLLDIYGSHGISFPKFENAGGGSPKVLVNRAKKVIQSANKSYSSCLIIGDDDQPWTVEPPRDFKRVAIMCVKTQGCIEVLILRLVKEYRTDELRDTRGAKHDFSEKFEAEAHKADFSEHISKELCEEMRLELPQLDQILEFFGL